MGQWDNGTMGQWDNGAGGDHCPLTEKEDDIEGQPPLAIKAKPGGTQRAICCFKIFT